MKKPLYIIAVITTIAPLVFTSCKKEAKPEPKVTSSSFRHWHHTQYTTTDYLKASGGDSLIVADTLQSTDSFYIDGLGSETVTILARKYKKQPGSVNPTVYEYVESHTNGRQSTYGILSHYSANDSISLKVTYEVDYLWVNDHHQDYKKEDIYTTY